MLAVDDLNFWPEAKSRKVGYSNGQNKVGEINTEKKTKEKTDSLFGLAP